MRDTMSRSGDFPFESANASEFHVSATWQQGVFELAHPEIGIRTLYHELRTLPNWQLFWPQDPPLADEFLRDLIASRPLRRLRQIGFLGAIDYFVHGNGQAPHRRRHNRFDHSVNVAILALRYAIHRGLSRDATRALAAAALLHDVGHGPLSHTLEPMFEKLFHINHHGVGRAIVNGHSPFGHDVPNVFARHGVDLEQVIELLSGVSSGPHAFLFDSPINLDTIEAIARCCLFTRLPHAVVPTEFVDAIATRDEFPVELGDRFWAIKDTVYRTVIFSNSGLFADIVAQQYMTRRAARFRADDFFLDDPALRRKHRDLFELLSRIRTRRLTDESPLSVDFNQEVETAARRFLVNAQAPINHPADLRARYTQHRRKRKLRLRDLWTPNRPGEPLISRRARRSCGDEWPGTRPRWRRGSELSAFLSFHTYQASRPWPCGGSISRAHISGTQNTSGEPAPLPPAGAPRHIMWGLDGEFGIVVSIQALRVRHPR